MADQTAVLVRRPLPAEQPWIEHHLRDRWGSTTIVSRRRAHDASRLPALVAIEETAIVGLATFDLVDDECELVTIDAVQTGRGVGSALLVAVGAEAARHGCRRLWLITTNDNLDAIRFYQRRGLRFVAVHRGAADDARALKPTIPLIGEHGIPVHDEIELELRLSPERATRG